MVAKTAARLRTSRHCLAVNSGTAAGPIASSTTPATHCLMATTPAGPITGKARAADRRAYLVDRPLPSIIATPTGLFSLVLHRPSFTWRGLTMCKMHPLRPSIRWRSWIWSCDTYGAWSRSSTRDVHRCRDRARRIPGRRLANLLGLERSSAYGCCTGPAGRSRRPRPAYRSSTGPGICSPRPTTWCGRQRPGTRGCGSGMRGRRWVAHGRVPADLASPISRRRTAAGPHQHRDRRPGRGALRPRYGAGPDRQPPLRPCTIADERRYCVLAADDPGPAGARSPSTRSASARC